MPSGPPGRGRAPSARDGAPNLGGVRGVLRRPDCGRGVLAPVRERRRRVRDHLRGRARRRRGQHPGGVRDAPTATCASRSTGAVSRPARLPPGPPKRGGGDRRHPGRRDPVVRRQTCPWAPDPPVPIDDVRIQLEHPEDHPTSPTPSPSAGCHRPLARRRLEMVATSRRAPLERARFYAAQPVDGASDFADEIRPAARGARRGPPGSTARRRFARSAGRSGAGEVLVAAGSRRRSCTSRWGPASWSVRAGATRPPRCIRGSPSGRPASSAGRSATAEIVA